MAICITDCVRNTKMFQNHGNVSVKLKIQIIQRGMEANNCQFYTLN